MTSERTLIVCCTRGISYTLLQSCLVIGVYRGPKAFKQKSLIFPDCTDRSKDYCRAANAVILDVILHTIISCNIYIKILQLNLDTTLAR